jgi:hypothetical protein
LTPVKRKRPDVIAADLRSEIPLKDLKMLNKLRIPPQLLREAGVTRVTTKQAEQLGFRWKPQRPDDSLYLQGVFFPYCDESGAIKNGRIRRDHPETDAEGKPEKKYICMPKGHERLLYWPPGARELLKDPATEILLVEAEKSALAITAAARRARRKLIALALGGCWGWRETVQDLSAPLKDLEALRGRKICVTLDANVASNPEIQRAELALCLHLVSVLGASATCHRVPVEADVNGPDDYLAKHHKDRDFWALLDSPVEPWLAEVGESYEKYSHAKPPEFVVKDFLQSGGLNIVGGLSGHGKTWLLLSLVQSLLKGGPLFGYFPVVRQASRVLYLTPEIVLGSFRLRAEKFGLGPFVERGKLVVRTLSAYPMLPLTDPAVLLCAQGADVFLDTAIRFMDGDESSSSDNDRGLAAGIFRLLQSGARTVTAAHHSPKGFEKAAYMSLETVLRGTGDIGAMAATAWGVRMLDAMRSRIQVECLKARDFEPPPPFQLDGKPHIDAGQGFQMSLKPGECGHLSAYVEAKKGGRPRSPEKAERQALLFGWAKEGKSDAEIASLLPEKLKIAPATLKKELGEARRQAKAKY